jgi:hypothetical protein
VDAWGTMNPAEMEQHDRMLFWDWAVHQKTVGEFLDQRTEGFLNLGKRIIQLIRHPPFLPPECWEVYTKYIDVPNGVFEYSLVEWRWKGMRSSPADPILSIEEISSKFTHGSKVLHGDFVNQIQGLIISSQIPLFSTFEPPVSSVFDSNLYDMKLFNSNWQVHYSWSDNLPKEWQNLSRAFEKLIGDFRAEMKK